MSYYAKPLDERSVEMSRAHWDAIAKPLDSLGLFEKIITRVAGIQGTSDVALEKKCVLVLCADNGVVQEGVTQTGSHVTALVARSLAEGTASVNAMARAARADVIPVDVGMLTDVHHPRLLRRKLACGTENIARGPAMTRGEAEEMIARGIALAGECRDQGYTIIATGEMGIGNTTTSSAVASALLNQAPEKMTGRGAGLSGEGLKRKLNAIKQAIKVNQPDPDDAIDVLSKLGGFDLAAMAGVFLGGARYGVPIVVDGFISSVAALIAVRLLPEASEYMLASHVSREPAGQMLLEALGLAPIIHAEMALGEGTGAVALFPLIDMALAVYRQNTSFDKIEVPAYEKLD